MSTNSYFIIIINLFIFLRWQVKKKINLVQSNKFNEINEIGKAGSKAECKKCGKVFQGIVKRMIKMNVIQLHQLSASNELESTSAGEEN